MNGPSQNGKTRNFENTYPGCLGRMVNLFELNIGVSANKLLTDKPHRDGSPVSRSRSDVSRMSPSLGQVEEKVIVSESKHTPSNRKSNGTPMKMLIAQEMSKEVDTRRSPPNLVAKLMGLDALPQQEPEPAIKRSHYKGHHRSHSEIPMSNWEQQDRFFQYGEPNEYKDVYEIWEQPQKFSNDKKMALVRQKFVEAKRLSTDEKLRQSKQFQDALEVLSSNKDLFLRCLQEPNSVFSQQLYSLHSIPPPPETKRITVLKPSKMTENLNFEGKKSKKGFPPANYKNYDNNPSQPTRIVVLKPSLEKLLDDKAVTSPQSQSARIIHGEDFFGDVEDNEIENHESREVAKAITNQMREKLGRPHRDDDETAIYSALPNGYVADESSFNKSETEYPAGNLSDSEATSPVSRHSWDYVNRLGSPFSSSSFSRASYSPESSVCREAKKRLSERWALMASNGSSQEQQRHVRRSSSTLGEMLALSETKKETLLAEKRASNSNEELKDLSTILVSGQNENVDNSPRSLTRSKSVPVSSSEFGTRLDAESSVPKEEAKAKSVKSSFKGKVSSLFFSRSKKASKENKSIGSETKDEISSDGTENYVEKVVDHSSSGMVEPTSKASSSNVIFKQGVISPEAQFPVSKSVASGYPGENQDQPSPISVLDPPFELNERTAKVLSRVDPDQYGFELSPNPISSNLIDKSPPIGSIARTLSWDDANIDTASSSYPSALTTQDTNEEDQEWYFFVKTLLSVSGLQGEEDGEAQPNSFFARWHSPESPLDPSLRDRYIDLNDKKTLHEAKRRQKRSMQKLVFDCVNTVLVELTGYGPGSGTGLDEVWARMNAWFSGECDCGDESGLVVERVVRTEVAGKGWVENLRLERGILGNEIEGNLMDELLQEAVVELTGRQ
ncbi:protein trm32 [Phtheirospermum japonicum]|uniref:Protein trm32 n=1 Tax=Phtheirospermum japonicum TaxID=374723 RepID=A0A830C473_9LAMI|nr:protein trm32 [Phtheirospermum japonicum]